MRRVPRTSERLRIASPSRLQNKRCELVDYSLRTSGDSSYRRQVGRDLPNMYAESRIHPIYRLERQNCADKLARSGGRLRGAGSRRATWWSEVSRPLPGAQAAVLQVGRSQ